MTSTIEKNTYDAAPTDAALMRGYLSRRPEPLFWTRLASGGLCREENRRATLDVLTLTGAATADLEATYRAEPPERHSWPYLCTTVCDGAQRMVSRAWASGVAPEVGHGEVGPAERDVWWALGAVSAAERLALAESILREFTEAGRPQIGVQDPRSVGWARAALAAAGYRETYDGLLMRQRHARRNAVAARHARYAVAVDVVRRAAELVGGWRVPHEARTSEEMVQNILLDPHPGGGRSAHATALMMVGRVNAHLNHAEIEDFAEREFGPLMPEYDKWFGVPTALRPAGAATDVPSPPT